MARAIQWLGWPLIVIAILAIGIPYALSRPMTDPIAFHMVVIAAGAVEFATDPPILVGGVLAIVARRWWGVLIVAVIAGIGLQTLSPLGFHPEWVSSAISRAASLILLATMPVLLWNLLTLRGRELRGDA